MRRRALLPLALATASVVSTAHAEPRRDRFSLDLYGGPYRPGGSAAFSTLFGDERGPMFGFDTTVHVVNIPHVGPLGVVASAGWARWSAKACADAGCTQRADETVNYDLFPLAVMGALRVDSLYLDLHVPIFLEGAAGLEFIRFRESRGGEREAYGGAFGLRWRARVGLFLDVFDRRAARALDAEYGVRHSYLFGEVRGSTADGALPVADPFTWMLGFGLTL